MSLFIEEEGNTVLPFDTEATARLVVDAALEYADCPYEAEVNLLLTENEEIHEMNLEQREIDRATDVLSFPMIEYETPGDFSVIDEETGEAFNPETGELMLGDIVISKEKVLSQAEEYGHSPRREYAFLIAHSMLHLFGYDHMVDEERIVMEAKQREIMEIVGIPR
nr:rRNA maturation RNase YbeY [uncultured Mediterraneibacter sp.]